MLDEGQKCRVDVCRAGRSEQPLRPAVTNPAVTLAVMRRVLTQLLRAHRTLALTIRTPSPSAPAAVSCEPPHAGRTAPQAPPGAGRPSIRIVVNEGGVHAGR